MVSKFRYVNFYAEPQNDGLLVTDLIPNEPAEIFIVLESDKVEKNKFLSIAIFNIKKIRTQYQLSIEFYDNSFSIFEKSTEYDELKSNNDFKKYYSILKKHKHGLFRDVLLSSGSVDLNGSFMASSNMSQIESMTFLKGIESLCNLFLDTNTLLYHFVFVLRKYGVNINAFSWNIVPAVIWELENIGKRKKSNLYEVRKSKSAFRDISYLINLGVMVVNNNVTSYVESDDKIIRKQIKELIETQPIFNGIYKKNYFVTFDNMMALAAYAEGIETIQLNMPLEEQYWEISNLSIFLSQLAEIFGTIKIKQKEHIFYLQGDWPGKSANQWCRGDIRYLAEYPS